MLVRREAFAAVDGFDPGFFLYAEETDLCLRLRERGWEIGFVPEVTVRHIGGASEQGNDPYETRLRGMAGIHRFWAKHYPTDDVKRLVWRDWLRSNFRRRWYGITRRFHGPGSRAWLKHREYAAISEASRRFLGAGLGSVCGRRSCGGPGLERVDAGLRSGNQPQSLPRPPHRSGGRTPLTGG